MSFHCTAKRLSIDVVCDAVGAVLSVSPVPVLHSAGVPPRAAHSAGLGGMWDVGSPSDEFRADKTTQSD